MTVIELMDLLGEYGDHLNVVVQWDEDSSQLIEVNPGIDDEGLAAVIIEVR